MSGLVALLLAVLVVAPAGAAGVAAPQPFWVANYVPTALWSGSDAAAADFGPLAQFTPLLALGAQGDRLLVLNPANEGTAYVDAAAVGPVGPPASSVLLTAGDGGRRLVHVEVAATPDQWQRGLMGRQALPSDSGMLFVFPQDETLAFWMKDTPLPLSIAFFAADGTVLSVQDMQPETTDLHSSPAPYRYALEAPQGYFAAHGVTAGATAAIMLPS